ncbi:MAG: protein-disulfide reductase DsbD N-terminal domain-containing protein [Alphaproteobacteria bacterium]|nr:protein-disulfide reductase DsbD N-terminal domain-containing protein [Alphaproteobacteria bacterium]
MPSPLLLSTLLAAACVAPVSAGDLLPASTSSTSSTSSSVATSGPEIEVVGMVQPVAPGEQPPVVLTIVVPPGFHVYKDMVNVEVLDAGGLALGPASLPAGLMTSDPALPGNTREQYDFDVIIEVPVTAPPPAGTHEARFSVRYQACKQSLCLFPNTVEVVAGLKVPAAG